jgi:hypothetical protein
MLAAALDGDGSPSATFVTGNGPLARLAGIVGSLPCGDAVGWPSTAVRCARERQHAGQGYRGGSSCHGWTLTPPPADLDGYCEPISQVESVVAVAGEVMVLAVGWPVAGEGVVGGGELVAGSADVPVVLGVGLHDGSGIPAEAQKFSVEKFGETAHGCGDERACHAGVRLCAGGGLSCKVGGVRK